MPKQAILECSHFRLHQSIKVHGGRATSQSCCSTSAHSNSSRALTCTWAKQAVSLASSDQHRLRYMFAGLCECRLLIDRVYPSIHALKDRPSVARNGTHHKQSHAPHQTAVDQHAPCGPCLQLHLSLLRLVARQASVVSCRDQCTSQGHRFLQECTSAYILFLLQPESCRASFEIKASSWARFVLARGSVKEHKLGGRRTCI